MKKFISVLLVMVMMVSILAISASATEAEPRYVVTHCTKCGGSATMNRVLISEDIVWVNSCAYANYVHYHDLYIYNVNVSCSNCGSYTYTTSESICA